MGGIAGPGPIPKESMPYDETLETKLLHYDQNLPLEDKKLEVILSRREIIEELLLKQLDIDEIHIIGSYARETMIENVEGNDIDVMFVLNQKHKEWLVKENGPRNCLQTIKRILENDPRFKNCEIKIDKNAVTVRFRDFSIDIVPAFKHEKDGYKIPDTYKKPNWIQTNPRMFKKIIEVVNNKHNGRVSEVVRIVKGWNENNGRPLKSFHIETMVYDYYKNLPKDRGTALNEDIQNFFRELPWRIRMQTRDPVYPEKPIDTYLTKEQKDIAIRKADLLNRRLSRANELNNQGAVDESIKEYQKIFGNKFE